MASAPPVIKVAALCGSLRKGPTIVLSSDPSMWTFRPFLNTDVEVNGTYPSAVEACRKKIEAADSILFASPEYNYSVTGPLKNTIDWASSPPNVWANKAAAMASAGGGFGGGCSQDHLRQIGVYLDLHFINKPEFFLNAFQPPAKFSSDAIWLMNRPRKS